MWWRSWGCRLVVGLAALALTAGCSPDTGTTPSGAQVSSAAPSTTTVPSDVPSPSAPPPSSLPAELVGSWASAGGSRTLRLVGCAIDEWCGTLVDDACPYRLVYRSRTATGFSFEVLAAETYSCGYSPWPDSQLSIRPASDGTLDASVSGWSNGLSFHRVTSSPAPSPRSLASLPPELVGSWAAASGSPALTLTPCAEGEVCGRFERVDDNSEHCVYVLQYRPPTSDHFVFISADANSFGCAYSPWMDEIYVRPMSDGTVVVWPPLPPGAGVTLSPVDSAPAPSASPSGGG